MKIILSGIAGSGKTMIIQSVFMNQDLEDTYTPTIGVHKVSTSSNNLEIVELGGTDCDQYLEEIDILTGTDILLYVVDIHDEDKYHESIEYLDKLVQIFVKMDELPDIYLFYHKADSIRDSRMKMLTINKIIQREEHLNKHITKNFSTSIKSNLAYNAMKQILKKYPSIDLSKEKRYTTVQIEQDITSPADVIDSQHSKLKNVDDLENKGGIEELHNDILIQSSSEEVNTDTIRHSNEINSENHSTGVTREDNEIVQNETPTKNVIPDIVIGLELVPEFINTVSDYVMENVHFNMEDLDISDFELLYLNKLLSSLELMEDRIFEFLKIHQVTKEKMSQPTKDMMYIFLDEIITIAYEEEIISVEEMEEILSVFTKIF
ncbi:MAG: hypothetical protein INQ03_17800 [Candidatus Heimdallarchaeota archaeon]|nr:hypothetical protein [Candidatus Heimdallarchaeota archaeon]